MKGRRNDLIIFLLIYSTFAYYNLLRSGGGYPGERGTGEGVRGDDPNNGKEPFPS
ncbi:MAG: hypothetical protein WCX92_08440 [Thermovirgaceae bacterium]|nr:hypothetical protein [Synergistales bacterium]MDD4023109.1 hypothetical protein [Synergistales bacterium]HPE90828.1 hypothetical protein [Synergistales bacterium]